MRLDWPGICVYLMMVELFNYDKFYQQIYNNVCQGINNFKILSKYCISEFS